MAVCRRVLQRFPRSAEAAEAQFLLASSLEAQRQYGKAFEAYQDVVEQYPQTDRMSEVVERQYRIANLFFTGRKDQLLGFAVLPGDDRAIYMFERVVENEPFGTYADLALFKMGQAQRRAGRYDKAEEAFQRIVEHYPTSALGDDAAYQLVMTRLEGALGRTLRDEDMVLQGAAELERFIAAYPDSELVEDARAMLTRSRDRHAQATFEIAEFYERRGQWAGARVYYEQVREEYRGTPWGDLAQGRLRHLPTHAPEQWARDVDLSEAADAGGP